MASRRWPSAPALSTPRGRSPSPSPRPPVSLPPRARTYRSETGSTPRSSSASRGRAVLLAKRVTTVDAFRREMEERWRGGSTSADKAIPVALYPGESVGQYSYKFERWLAGKDVPLASLAQDPNKERSLWHTFAHHRVGRNSTSAPWNLKRRAEGEAEQLESKRPRYGAALTAASDVADSPRHRDKSVGTEASERTAGDCDDAQHLRDDSMPPRSSWHPSLPQQASTSPRSDGIFSSSRHQRSVSPPARFALGEAYPAPRLKSRTELLARRVLSVKEYVQEKEEHKRNPPLRVPGQRATKIPVPLWPGETREEYESKFRRWLAQHHVLLGSLRSQPVKERGYRHQFAHTRIVASKTMHHEGTREEEFLSRAHTHSSFPHSHPETRAQVEEERHAPSCAMFHREEERHLDAGADLAIHAEEQSDLLPRDQQSQMQLSREASSSPPLSVASSAQAERADAAAQTAATGTSPRSDWSSSSSQVGLPTSLPARLAQRETTAAYRSNKPASLLAQRVLSMEEFRLEIEERRLNPGAKKTRVGPPGPAKIPVPLWRGELLKDYEKKFYRWLVSRVTAREEIDADPEKERFYRHEFAYKRAMMKTVGYSGGDEYTSSTLTTRARSRSPARTLENGDDGDDGDDRLHDSSCALSRAARSRLQQRESDQIAEGTEVSSQPPNPEGELRTRPSRSSTTSSTLDTQETSPVSSEQCNIDIGRDHPAPTAGALSSCTPKEGHDCDLQIDSLTFPERLPSWAVKLINRVQQLEHQMASLQGQIASGNAVTNQLSSPVKPADGLFSRRDCAAEDRGGFFHAPTYTIRLPEEEQCDKMEKASCEEAQKMSPSHAEHAEKRREEASLKDEQGKINSGKLLASNDDIQRQAVVNLANAVRLRVGGDPEARRLTETYNHLNGQIGMNETAIDDALAYVKAIKDVDAARALEHHNQIMELCVSINKEKEKRDAALVSLIAHSWAGRHDELMEILLGEKSKLGKGGTLHEKCATISARIETKDNELETLEIQLNGCLQALNATPASFAEEDDRTPQVEALQGISSKLTAEQAAKDLLENERQVVYMSFLKSSDEIRKLLKDRICDDETRSVCYGRVDDMELVKEEPAEVELAPADGRAKACAICDQTFLTDDALRLHESSAHSSAQPPPPDAPEPARAEDEKSDDSSDQKPSKTCPKCGKTFATSTNLRTHLSNVSPCVQSGDPAPPQELQMGGKTCPKCGKKFASSQGLRGHLNRVNPCDGERKVPRVVLTKDQAAKRRCDKCGKTFASAQSLRFHINRVKPCDQEKVVSATDAGQKEEERKARARFHARKTYLKRLGRLDELGEFQSVIHPTTGGVIQAKLLSKDRERKRSTADEDSPAGSATKRPRSEENGLVDDIPMQSMPDEAKHEPPVPQQGADTAPPTHGRFVRRPYRGHGGDLLAGGCSCPPCVRRWARKLMARMQQLEDEVVTLRRQAANGGGRDGAKALTASPVHNIAATQPPPLAQQVASNAERVEAQSSSLQTGRSFPTKYKPEGVVEDAAALSPAASLDAKQDQNLGQKDNVDATTSVSSPPLRGEALSDTTKPDPDSATTIDNGQDQEASGTQSMSDVKKDLTDAYDHLNAQILLNERAVEDSISHVRLLMDADKAAAVEFQSQIDELQVSINVEKGKRDVAVAALVAHEWRTRHDEFEALVGPVAARSMPGAMQTFHEKCAEIATQMAQKDQLLAELAQTIEAVRGATSPVGNHGGRRSRYEELGGLSSKIFAEQAAKEVLDREREEVFMCLVKSSRQIWSLVRSKLAEM
ncbi:hypothetical protein BBJ28_00001098 [Nothophytophthora sp. Chile5]|nr:hypothetical protein BBJ28_00001098 [Nothophytophthora sp. Chile5]